MATAAGTSTSKVLVIDDNEANRLLVRSTLEDEGYVVVTASGGAQGIQAFDQERPDCVLLDVRMPEIDGFQVCERIRTMPGGAATPVLFLTAQRDIDSFDRALRAGGDDFLLKPILPTELLVRVQTALRLRRLGEDVRQQFEELRHQRDALVRVQLQKERLMAFVVHDLKSPVQAVDLHAQLLQEHSDLPEEVREGIAMIRTAAQQLSRMILDLLDVSKADEGRLVPARSRLDLRTLVDQVLADVGLSARERSVALETAVETRGVDADPDLLRRMLTNLVENAIRYSPAGKSVRVTAKPAGQTCELRVTDAGPGIPEAMREKVFEPFAQLTVDGPASDRSGRGLGLTFCRLVAEAHGGRIWIEDASPGAAFFVTLATSGALP